MATEEIQISQLELADEVLADMTLPVDTATETRAVTLKQLKAWLGSSLPTGFIIPAVGKISDARFTLLDGKTLTREGTYSAFCNKVVSEVQAGNWFACSEEEYNADVSAFGQCGRFVITNDYVRIPKITRFIGATITLSEIGKTYKESLPNITGNFNADTSNPEANGAFTYGYNVDGGGTGYVRSRKFSFDASRSSTTYKNGAKVQPDQTKYPYYMVVSSDGQTEEVGVDINKVYEDLELKANKNLSNLTTEGKKLVSGLGMPSGKYINLALGASGSTYTAPVNGYYVIEKRASDNGQYIYFGHTSIPYCQKWYICKIIHPIKKGNSISIHYDLGGNTELFGFIYAEGEN